MHEDGVLTRAVLMRTRPPQRFHCVCQNAVLSKGEWRTEHIESAGADWHLARADPHEDGRPHAPPRDFGGDGLAKGLEMVVWGTPRPLRARAPRN